MLNGVVQHIRKLASHGETTDGQLLSNFIKRRDNDALTTLVTRHGPMVWAVCRRILRSQHDADDAFQATFLVLVRKAGTIRNREGVASWLYGVAHQTAVRLRTNLAKQHRREQHGDLPDKAQLEEQVLSDVQALLDQELSHLPEKYRLVIVLCDLEGRTRKEVARHLKCPEGTVAGRLARARDILAKRLSQKGVSLSAGVLVAALSREAAAAVPLSIAGNAGIAERASAGVLALTDEVIRAMLITKLKIATTVLLAVGLLGYSSSTLVSPAADRERAEVARPGRTEGAASLVQVRIGSPQGTKIGFRPSEDKEVSQIEAPGRLNLAWGHVYRLKLHDIPQRPGASFFPTLELPMVDAATRPFLNSSAVPVGFTDDDFEQVDRGNTITKVVYLRTGVPATLVSYECPDQDVIQEATRRGSILAIVRMGNIDLEGRLLPADPNNTVEIKLGDDGKLDVVRVGKDRMDRALAELAKAQAKNDELRQQLKAMELEIKSLRTLLERKVPEGRPRH
jgi:RNA polymerase sigma factor (sigma-70 family)